MKYRLSNQASLDIEEIWYFTYKKWSKQQADHYYNLIIKEIEFIADNVYSGKSLEGSRKGYRYSPIKSHLIFYRKANDQVIEIIRVLHKRMEIKKQLE